jgi:hypothetical protein
MLWGRRQQRALLCGLIADARAGRSRVLHRGRCCSRSPRKRNLGGLSAVRAGPMPSATASVTTSTAAKNQNPPPKSRALPRTSVVDEARGL